MNPDRVQDVIIHPFHPEDQAEVKRLVLSGLVEHWGTLDPAKNPDLDDIAHFYADGVFLVARQGSRIIGCGALLPRSGETAEIVRMSVAAQVRRNGLGRMILQNLCGIAGEQGYRRLILETTETWQDVIAFYQDFGFRITHHLDGDAYFELAL